MIDTVLIDDERPALRELEYLLRSYPEFNICGSYINPSEAIDCISSLKPQVVFLDINMPQLKGIDAASMILENNPDTDIVFVTAYDEYAVEAFEVHALDYILKPVNKVRFQKTIERVLDKQRLRSREASEKLKIRCFGKFEIGWEDQEPIKWRAEKTKELFAFMLCNKDKDISKDELLDKLWEEDDPEKAIRQLYNGIYYIRKTLQDHGINRSLISIDGNYSLKTGRIDYDVEAFEELAGSGSDDIDILTKQEALYRGDYLQSEYYPWADFERDRLARLYLNCLLRLSEKHIEHSHWEMAESLLLKAYSRDPYEEKITENLLKLYLATGEKSKAVIHFTRYCELLRKELRIKPHINIIKLYQTIM